jgi:hypothetical protein
MTTTERAWELFLASVVMEPGEQPRVFIFDARDAFAAAAVFEAEAAKREGSNGMCGQTFISGSLQDCACTLARGHDGKHVQGPTLTGERHPSTDDGAGLQDRLTRQVEANTAHLAKIATLEKQLSEEVASHAFERDAHTLTLARENAALKRERTATADALRMAAKMLRDLPSGEMTTVGRTYFNDAANRVQALIPAGAGSAEVKTPEVSADAIAAAEARGLAHAVQQALAMILAWRASTESIDQLEARIRTMKDTPPPSAHERKLSHAEQNQILSDAAARVRVGAVYEHASGVRYVVQGLALESTNGRPRMPVVRYQSNEGPPNVRDLEEFLRRFAFVGMGGANFPGVDLQTLRTELRDKLAVCTASSPGFGEHTRHCAQALQFMFELGWKAARGEGEPPDLLTAPPSAPAPSVEPVLGRCATKDSDHCGMHHWSNTCIDWTPSGGKP